MVGGPCYSFGFGPYDLLCGLDSGLDLCRIFYVTMNDCVRIVILCLWTSVLCSRFIDNPNVHSLSVPLELSLCLFRPHSPAQLRHLFRNLLSFHFSWETPLPPLPYWIHQLTSEPPRLLCCPHSPVDPNYISWTLQGCR